MHLVASPSAFVFSGRFCRIAAKAVLYALLAVVALLATLPFALAEELSAAPSFHNLMVDAADKGSEEEVASLIRMGNPVDSRGDFGATPLMRAAFRGHTSLVKTLILLGADVDAVDIAGATALHLAVRGGHPESVQLLLQANAEPDSSDDEGWTPLMRASGLNNTALVNMLLEKGADPLKTNLSGDSAISYAVKTDSVAAAEALLKSPASAKITPPMRGQLADLSVKQGNKQMQALLGAKTGQQVQMALPVQPAPSVPSAPSVIPLPVKPVQQAEPAPKAPQPKLIQLTRSAPLPVTEASNRKEVEGLPWLNAAALPAVKAVPVPVVKAAPAAPIAATMKAAPPKLAVPVPAAAAMQTPPSVLPKSDVAAAPVSLSVQPVPGGRSTWQEPALEKPKELPPVAPIASPALPRASAPLPLPPSVSVAKGGVNVRVAEPIRVPLSSKQEAAPSAVKAQILPQAVSAAVPVMRFSPSNSKVTKGSLWVEVSSFSNAREASAYYDSYAENPVMQGLRMRIVTPFSSSNGDEVLLQLGPVNDGDAVDALCKLLENSGKSCYTMTDMGKSTASGRQYNEAEVYVKPENRKEEFYKGQRQVWLQLGSFGSEEAAENRRDALKDSLPELQNVSFYISLPKNTSGAALTFRLRAGAFRSYEEASQRCDSLFAKNIDCIVVQD